MLWATNLRCKSHIEKSKISGDIEEVWKPCAKNMLCLKRSVQAAGVDCTVHALRLALFISDIYIQIFR